MKICFVIATRPEIIKCSPIIRQCIKKKVNFFITHTGQHYTFNLDKIFFKELKIPKPKYFLKVKSKHPTLEGDHTGRMLAKLDPVLIKEHPDYVIVQGDTNTTLAGALVTAKISTKKIFKNKIKLVHVESGLRSYDKMMPEERNRIVADHLSDILFPPTKISFNNLKKENLVNKNTLITGNTIVDSINENKKFLEKNKILNKLNLKKKNYFVVTMHRPETVDNLDRLLKLLNIIKKLTNIYSLPAIFPIHPRTKKNLKKINLNRFKKIMIIEPLSYINFLNLQKNAKLILTDSGGVQEEACILKVPCVTLRENTERPETINIGANIIAGYKEKKILYSVSKMIKKSRNWRQPFGNGTASVKIIKYLISKNPKN